MEALGGIGKGLKDAIDVGLEAVDQGRKGLKGLKDAIDASEIIGKNLNDAINAGGPILGKGLKDAINAGLGAVGPSLVDWFSQLFAGGTENPGGNPGENPEGNPEGNLGGNNQTPQPNTIKF